MIVSKILPARIISECQYKLVVEFKQWGCCRIQQPSLISLILMTTLWMMALIMFVFYLTIKNLNNSKWISRYIRNENLQNVLFRSILRLLAVFSLQFREKLQELKII